MSRRKDRPRKIARRSPFREPKPRILVVCEGVVTEPQYIRAFANSCRNSRVDVEIDDSHGVAKTLVQSAKKRKKAAETLAKKEADTNLKYNQVWVVFDNEHPDVSGALEMARQVGVDTAVSNPNFELWLLLHFRSDPGTQTKLRLVELLTEHLPNYQKHVDYTRCAPGYADAVKRAMRLDETARNCGQRGRNPTTTVYKLTESIRGETGYVDTGDESGSE